MNTSLNDLIANIKTLFANYGSGDYQPTEQEKQTIDQGLTELLDDLFSEADTVLMDNELDSTDYPKRETTGPVVDAVVVDAEKIGLNKPVCLVHKDAWDHAKGQMKEPDVGWTNPENVLVDPDYMISIPAGVVIDGVAVEIKNKPTVWVLFIEWNWGEDDKGSCFQVSSTRDLAIVSLGDYLQDNWIKRMSDPQGEVGREEPEAECPLTEEDMPTLNNIDDIEAAAEQYFDALGGYEQCRLGEVHVDGNILEPVEIEHG